MSGEEYEIIKSFTVLYEGWELDNKAWVVNVKGENKLVMTNHGRLYFAEAVELKEKIKEYKQIWKDTKEALDLLNKEK